MPHVWKVKRMAKANSVDLSAALQAGALSVDDWARMVTRCRGCQWVDGCATWLDRTEKADHAPEACLNRDALARLRAEDPA
nr:DUF6455 family protein [Cognatishimia sp. F0-27]